MDREQLALLIRLRDLVSGMVPSSREEFPRHDIVPIILFSRSMSLFDGILTLLEKGMFEESLILGRSLFEEALWLAEMRNLENERAAVALGWMNRSIQEKMGLVREAERLGMEEDPNLIIQQLKADRKSLQNYQKRRGIGRLKKFQSVADASKAYGREKDYWIYTLSHEMVHGSDAGAIFRRKKIGVRESLIFTRAANGKLLAAAGCFAARSLVQSATSIAGILRWKTPDELEITLSQVEEFEQEIKTTN